LHFHLEIFHEKISLYKKVEFKAMFVLLQQQGWKLPLSQKKAAVISNGAW